MCVRIKVSEIICLLHPRLQNNYIFYWQNLTFFKPTINILFRIAIMTLNLYCPINKQNLKSIVASRTRVLKKSHSIQ